MKSVYIHLEKRQVSQTGFCKHFGLHNDERIHAYLMKLSNNNDSDSGVSYETVMNSQSYTICSGITRPWRFSLGNIPTMSGITDSIGEGWDERKIENFFRKETTLYINKKRFPWLHQNILNKHTSPWQRWQKLNWQQRKGNEIYSPLNVICLPLNLKMKQITSDMLQCSKMISTRSTLRKIWYFPCHIGLLLI